MNWPDVLGEYRRWRAFINAKISQAGIDPARIIYRARIRNFRQDVGRVAENWKIHRRSGLIENYDPTSIFVEYLPCGCRRCLEKFSPVDSFINALRKNGGRS